MRTLVPARALVLSSLFTALTAVGAWIRIPVPWSAYTFQVFFVFMAGVLLGPKLGALSQGLYVLIGLLGLPVFAGGGGVSYILQPTFGFLLSYIPAAAVTGALCKNVRFGRVAAACAAGLCVIYLIGLPYMALILNVYLHKSMSWGDILMSGMVIFLPFDAVKIALTGLLARVLILRLDRLRDR